MPGDSQLNSRHITTMRATTPRLLPMLSRFSPPSCHSSSTLVIIKMLGTTRWPKRRLRCYVGYRTLRFPALINESARNGWCSSTRERVAPAPVTIKCTGCAILSRGGNVLSSHQFDRVMMAFSDSPRDHAARPSVLRNRADDFHQSVPDSPNAVRLLSESLPAPRNRPPEAIALGAAPTFAVGTPNLTGKSS